MKTRITLATLGLIVFCAGTVFSQARKPHVTWSLDSCMTCHAQTERAELAKRITRPCRDLCASCHKFEKGEHHPVGVQISGAVREPLLLTKQGTNTCSTCHDVTKPVTSSAPWVSQSVIDQIVHQSNANKTFLLVMKNDRGQLCRNCH
jgi:hypothetical protein